MALEVQSKRLGDWLRQEEPMARSRDLATVLSGQNLKAGQVCCTDAATGKKKAISATGNETHTYTFTGTPTAGSFTLTLWHKDGYWVTTASIPYNASNGTLDAAIEAVLGTSAVTATATGAGTAITAISIVFGGTGYANTVQPRGSVDMTGVTGWTAVAWARATSAGAAQNEVQTFKFANAVAASDTVQVTLMTADGIPIVVEAVPFNTSVAQTVTDLNTAITQAATQYAGGASVGAVAASADGITWTLTYSGVGFAGLAWGLARVLHFDNTAIGTVTITRTTAGGSAGNRVGALADSICVNDTDASAADVANTPFIVRDAVVNDGGLVYGGGDPTACATALKALGVLVRSEATQQSFG